MVRASLQWNSEMHCIFNTVEHHPISPLIEHHPISPLIVVATSKIRMLLWTIFENLLICLFSVWTCCRAHPVFASILLPVLFVLGRRHISLHKKSKYKKDFFLYLCKCAMNALKNLSQTCEPSVNPKLLLDGILRQDHPTDEKWRRYLTEKVWPSALIDLEGDDRICRFIPAIGLEIGCATAL